MSKEIITKPLDMEAWLAMEVYPGMNMEYFIMIECAESGRDRENGFDIEIEQEERYELYLEAMDNNV